MTTSMNDLKRAARELELTRAKHADKPVKHPAHMLVARARENVWRVAFHWRDGVAPGSLEYTRGMEIIQNAHL